MTITSPTTFAIAAALLVLILLIAMVRRVALSRGATLLIFAGTILFCAAAGGLTIHLPDAREVVVMVDLSPSTRTATYRDPKLLETRIAQLLGSTRHRIEKFDESPNVERTIFAPPLADAIVLLSDGQFELPATAAPTYAVIDPNLEKPNDGAITRLESRWRSVEAMVHNPAGPRGIQFSGGTESPTTAPAGEPILIAQVDPQTTSITARLAPGDPWPENDALTIRPAPPVQMQQWWIGDSPPTNFRALSTSELPTDPTEYLKASAIVLNNISADALTSLQQQRLTQFVRDLGGGLVIIGGENAFGAGGYPGTPLDAISPLASSPPQPQRNWIILVDASGSMATESTGQTRWQRASAAAVQLVRRLPTNDTVSIGSFARDLAWWSRDRSADDTAKLALPPAAIAPSGPTNIQTALQAIASSLNSSTITEIILITDADATINNPSALAQSLQIARARVHLLATADASRSPILQLVTQTSGNIMTQPDASLWTDAAQKLLRSSLPDQIERGQMRLTFTGPLSQLPARTLESWNRTWIKSQAIELASSETPERRTMAGVWQIGLGQVAAAGFAASSQETLAMVERVSREPHDPRFKISRSSAKQVAISIDALDAEKPMNDLDIQLLLLNEADPSGRVEPHKLVQTAPGRYELSLPAPRTPMLATLRLGDRIIDRFAIAGRYAPEFDGIGNNRDALRALAQRTGGAVIESSQATPIDFHWPTRTASLASPLSVIGAALIAAGLLLWKRSS